MQIYQSPSTTQPDINMVQFGHLNIANFLEYLKMNNFIAAGSAVVKVIRVGGSIFDRNLLLNLQNFVIF